jgi:hypothetical protein
MGMNVPMWLLIVKSELHPSFLQRPNHFSGSSKSLRDIKVKWINLLETTWMQ